MGTVRLIPFTVEEILDAAPAKTEDAVPPGIKMIEAPDVWEACEYGKNAVIAVIDTGCQLDHPDLKDRVIDGRNFTDDYNGDPDMYNDNNGHGTHVCGTIAAAKSGEGVVGVAPAARLLVLKALAGDGSGQTEWIIDAISYCLDWRGPKDETVTVISMSLGGPDDDPELHDAVKKAVDHNILVVCAAGNEGDGRTDTPETSFPGDYVEVVEVGAVDYARQLASFSNTNDNVDVVAPGVNVLSTYLDSQYAVLSGTSMATPHVSGALALIKTWADREFGRALTEPELYAQLIRRTTELGIPKSGEGNGLVALALNDRIADVIKLLTPQLIEEPQLKANV
ncbi:S8 family peptidase [Camelliibacillus cellulosilyticus]|uniref:S8 family peptidase n=1 Tax=Camelliibacillus cellulosilyticus TaxID=2174486 RepID=A0ABV9GFS8_9BACL